MSVNILMMLSTFVRLRRLIERAGELKPGEAEEYIDEVFSGAPVEVRARLKEIVKYALDFRNGRISYDQAVEGIARAIGLDATMLSSFIALFVESLKQTFKSGETNLER